jgi:hypothetical protein
LEAVANEELGGAFKEAEYPEDIAPNPDSDFEESGRIRDGLEILG